MRSPWLRVGPKSSDKWPHRRRKTEKETHRPGGGRASWWRGWLRSGRSHRSPQRPRALLPEAPAETGAPRDAGLLGGGKAAAAGLLGLSLHLVLLRPRQSRRAKPHQHPGAAAAASRRVHRGCRNHVSFVASPPHPAPQKKGNWNRAGTQHADKWNCVLTGKGALSSGHFPHLILPPAAGLRLLTPDLEVTPGSGFGAASCSSGVGSVYS